MKRSTDIKRELHEPLFSNRPNHHHTPERLRKDSNLRCVAAHHLSGWHHRPLGHANGKWMGQDSNLRCFFVTDLQSAALATRHTHPWGDQGESVSAPLRSAQSRCPPDILRPHKQSHISAKRTTFALLPLSCSCGARTHHLRLERPAS